MKILLAKAVCMLAHRKQKRKYTGEPYYVHPFEVSDIVRKAGYNSEVQAAALLHDTVEDTWLKPYMIEVLFGKRVRDLVVMVTDVSKPEDGVRAFRKELDRLHLLEADSEGKTIKLADLISNAKTITEYDKDFARVYMKEKAALLEVLKEGDRDLYAEASGIVVDYFKGLRK